MKEENKSLSEKIGKRIFKKPKSEIQRHTNAIIHKIERDVKEFIRLLKEKIILPRYKKIINKLAGEKLI